MDERLEIEYVRLSDVQPFEGNPKDHDIPTLVEAIRWHGFVDSVVRDDRTGMMLAGHGRLEALQLMHAAEEDPPRFIAADDDGAWRIPVQVGYRSESDEEAKAVVVGLNRISEQGGWVPTKLVDFLLDVRSYGNPHLLETTGYHGEELDDMLRQHREELPPTVPVRDHDRKKPGEGNRSWQIISVSVPPGVYNRYVALMQDLAMSDRELTEAERMEKFVSLAEEAWQEF